MHELPKDLGNSLRSFRNSVHRHSGQYELDLEKLETPDHVFGGGEKQAHETSSSLILVRILMCWALNYTDDTYHSTQSCHDQL